MMAAPFVEMGVLPPTVPRVLLRLLPDNVAGHPFVDALSSQLFQHIRPGESRKELHARRAPVRDSV
jgi:hypothetical protein